MNIESSVLTIALLLTLPLLFAMRGESVSVPAVQNESEVEGTVTEYAVVSSGSVGIEPEQEFYKLVITIHSVWDVGSKPNFLMDKAGQDVLFYTKERIYPGLVGKRVKAKARYSGDERGGKYWISNIEEVKQER
jgi:hypothetical protein